MRLLKTEPRDNDWLWERVSQAVKVTKPLPRAQVKAELYHISAGKSPRLAFARRKSLTVVAQYRCQRGQGILRLAISRLFHALFNFTVLLVHEVQKPLW